MQKIFIYTSSFAKHVIYNDLSYYQSLGFKIFSIAMFLRILWIHFEWNYNFPTLNELEMECIDTTILPTPFFVCIVSYLKV